MCTCRWTKESGLSRLTWEVTAPSRAAPGPTNLLMSTLTTTEDSPVDLLGEEQPAYANRPDHRGRTHRQSRAPGGSPAASRACLRDAAGGDSDRAAVRAAGLAVGGSPGRGDADHRERLPLAPGALQDREELLRGLGAGHAVPPVDDEERHAADPEGPGLVLVGADGVGVGVAGEDLVTSAWSRPASAARAASVARLPTGWPSVK